MIQTSKSLASLVNKSRQVRCIALDTEFVWEKTYYPTLGVIQVGLEGEKTFLIDAPAIGDLSPLGSIIADPAVVKILHDAPQDLTILRRATTAFPKNIFDTRCAAGFVGLSASASLRSLLKEVLGVELAKTETRSNWLRRPLTPRQVAYAGDDVRYLPALRNRLLEMAREIGRDSWIEEELSGYDDPGLYEDNNPDGQISRIKGAGRLSPRARPILRELAAWRETEARRRNHPRSWVMQDEILLELARQRPGTIPELKSIKKLSEKTIHRYGETILKSIERGRALSSEESPALPEHTGINEVLTTRINFALAYLKGKCTAEGMDPTLVATRADVTALVRERNTASPETSILLRGWRRKYIGDEILRLLAGELAIRLDSETGLPRPVDQGGIN